MRSDCQMGGLVVFLLLSVSANADTVQVRKFTVPQAARQGLMGFAVSLRGDLGFAGAPAGTRAPGTGYLFDVNTGQLLRTIVPSVPRSDDLFGFNAKLSATRLLVGDPGNPYAAVRVPGAAYVFDLASGVETRRLLADDGFAGDEFGFGVNLSDDLAIIGAPAYKTGTGAAYLFDLVIRSATAQTGPARSAPGIGLRGGRCRESHVCGGGSAGQLRRTGAGARQCLPI